MDHSYSINVKLTITKGQFLAWFHFSLWIYVFFKVSSTQDTKVIQCADDATLRLREKLIGNENFYSVERLLT